MIKIENTEVFGWEAAIRGMRNPLNSWAKMDSWHCDADDCPHVMYGTEPAKECDNGECGFCVGQNDLGLMKKLATAGSDHGKFLRLINVTCDITAPLYWWKEFDTYKVGTVANSCSTMHKIHAKEFTLEDFSHEHLIHDWKDAEELVSYNGEYTDTSKEVLEYIIEALNHFRDLYLKAKVKPMKEEAKRAALMKRYWWQMIQLLPSSYNQKRTVQLNYQVLKSMYHARKNHKLDEWHDFCAWCESLPYFMELCCE